LGEGENGQILRVEKDLVELVRLGEGLSKNKRFSEQALGRARGALETFQKEIKIFGPQRILAMATAAARDAENKEDLENICRNLNIPLKIISGGEEARLTYQGALAELKSLPPSQDKNYLVIDVGGRSTELVTGRGSKFAFGKSISLGVVELTELHGLQAAQSSEETRAARQDVRQRLRKGFTDESGKRIFERPDQLLSVAGTPTALAQMFVGSFDAERIERLEISSEQIEEKIKEMLSLGPIGVTKKYQIPEKRSDVLLAGALILAEILSFLKTNHLKVSTKGIRYGIAMDLLR
jgi:exopolyphosphatase / guanosine-5'-triphosphate,3'-diphosphate pyrophosphatase